MAVSWLSRLAARARVPVFPALGMHGDTVLHRLALTPGIELVDSPRHASILLVAGGVPPDLHEALRRLHDQFPAPFATLWYRSVPLSEVAGDLRVDDPEALPEALKSLHRELMSGRRSSSPRLLPDEPPNPWEGLGDNGHGGEGMMGGVPYGRPMAMNMQDDIRDGLTLDSLTFTLGPFLPILPPGLGAKVTLQGDLIQSWVTQLASFPIALEGVFHEARQYPVPIVVLELARARYHLRRLAVSLRLSGLDRLALAALRLSQGLNVESRVEPLHRGLTRCGFFRLTTAGGGRLEKGQARRVGGIAARAAGLDEDLRSRDAAYRRLGFAPVVQRDGDTNARWRQTLAEIDHSLQLARQAVQENLYSEMTEAVETPRGPWGDDLPEDASGILEDLLPGLEWDEALTTIASLDLAGVSEWPLKPLSETLLVDGEERRA